jgi:hypothetical protein
MDIDLEIVGTIVLLCSELGNPTYTRAYEEAQYYISYYQYHYPKEYRKAVESTMN